MSGDIFPQRVPLSLDKQVDACTLTYLQVRLRVRDGEFIGAQAAVLEAMRNLQQLYATLEQRARQEREG